MKYIPHTEEDINEMLKTIKVESINDLFNNIPNDAKFKSIPKIPKSLNEFELLKYTSSIASKNITPLKGGSFFIGAGRYFHYIPEVIPTLISRGEFSTCYTPYQAEVSQGTLQSIYEYQTLICNLFNMEIANASLYDGASAFAEALFMAYRLSKKNKIYIAASIHPFYKEVAYTYLRPLDIDIIELDYKKDGTVNFGRIKNEDVCAIAIQSPNFFGVIEHFEELKDIKNKINALSIVTFTEPIAYGLLKPPGDFDVDIVCGEGQSLGLPPAFGGPSLGIFTTKYKYVRSIPGRLVGKTVDKEGKRAFCLTLTTREQHIRREKATSNICTNENLCALVANIYLSYMGKKGLEYISKQNYNKMCYLKDNLVRLGFKETFKSPTFNEFVLKAPKKFKKIQNKLKKKHIFAGINLKYFGLELEDHYLFTVTELNSKNEIDLLISEVKDGLK
ncbi:MAG: aminomethyl-transferring glycine dehydrogenase subunit GcvPA [Deferribacterota bacterium]|nr:aminomethyl-transferring glycine dehydrogenase subunit GcvPA [Deferribacterota bacterium]